MSALNQRRFVAFINSNENIQKAYQEIVQDIRTLANSPTKDNTDNLRFHFVLSKYGFSSLTPTQSKALAVYILEK